MKPYPTPFTLDTAKEYYESLSEQERAALPESFECLLLAAAYTDFAESFLRIESWGLPNAN